MRCINVLLFALQTDGDEEEDDLVEMEVESSDEDSDEEDEEETSARPPRRKGADTTVQVTSEACSVRLVYLVGRSLDQWLNAISAYDYLKRCW